MANVQVRAQDMSAREYKGLLTKIHNTGRRLDTLVAQGIAYCAYHHVAHGNKQPWEALIEAAPKFAHKIVRDARKACEHVDRADIETVLPDVESAAASQLEERRTKGAAPKAQADDKAGDVESYQLVHKKGSKVENKIDLTSEEFQAALDAVQALRESKKGDMDRAAKVEELAQRQKKTGTK